MKRALAVLFMVSLFFVTTLLFGITVDDKELYVRTFHISKILSHHYGYKVYYVKGDLEIGTFYIPIEWFVTDGKGAIVWGDAPYYPYCSIFWKDGKFDHIKLYLQTSFAHPTWGVLLQEEGEPALKEIFQAVTEPQLEEIGS